VSALPAIITKHWPDAGIDVLVNNAGQQNQHAVCVLSWRLGSREHASQPPHAEAAHAVILRGIMLGWCCSACSGQSKLLCVRFCAAVQACPAANPACLMAAWSAGWRWSAPTSWAMP
jgi:hypothetical protein